jgi:hypothetical protein
MAFLPMLWIVTAFGLVSLLRLVANALPSRLLDDVVVSKPVHQLANE